ncbi:MAG: glycosyltransferase family 2 protein [Gelidibacter sp.]
MKENLISIITINYNNAKGLLKTIESVVAQTFVDFEYIIIDGGSSDASVSVIEQFGSQINHWVSEPDHGIYNAMNKGIKVAKGDYILFMNSGDFLYNPQVLQDVFDKMSLENDLIYGDVLLRHKKNNWERLQVHPEVLPFSYFYKQTICQQACFFKRSLFDRLFYFNESSKISADWEFLIYAIYIEKVNYQKVGVLVAVYDMEGVSSTSEFRSLAAQEREDFMALYFPLFKDDYKRLKGYASPRFSQLKQIEQSVFLRKIVSVIFKVMLFFIPNKKN